MLVHIMAFVGLEQVSSNSLKIAGKEILSEAFLKHIQTEVAAVQRHGGPANAGTGNSSSPKHLTSQSLVAVSGVLDGIVKVNPSQAMKALVRVEMSEIKGKTWLVIQRAETAD